MSHMRDAHSPHIILLSSLHFQGLFFPLITSISQRAGGKAITPYLGVAHNMENKSCTHT